MTRFRSIVAVLLGLAFISIGIQHFLNPLAFDAIVPVYLGCPRFWTLASGVLEICLGCGLLFNRSRSLSAHLLVLLVLMMSLANLNMWLNDIPFNGTRLSTTGHSIRWILQLILLFALSWLGGNPRAVFTGAPS